MTGKTGNEILNDLVSNIAEGHENIIEVTKKVIGDKEAVTFGITRRQVNPEPPMKPIRLESPKKAHTFHDAKSMAEYLKKYKSSDTVVMIDFERETVQAVLDEQSSDGFQVISMKPIVHPVFLPWKRLLESGPVAIMALADFLSENRRIITDTGIVGKDHRSLVLALSQIKMSKTVTMQTGQGKNAINGVMVETNISGTKKQEMVDLPDTIKIRCPMYLSTPQVEIEIDFTYDEKDGRIVVKCKSADLLQKQVESFDKMMAEIQAIEGVTVVFGRPGYDDWDYIESDE